MIWVPVVWTNYTATAHGQVVKLVPCENCAAEYVYVLEREGAGVGVSLYLTNEEGRQTQAVSSAEDSLRQYLENDCDPVPCPVCGHYQRHMFPKLDPGPPTWVFAARLAVVLAGCITFVGAAYCSVAAFQRPGGSALALVPLAWSLLAARGLALFALDRGEQSRTRRFDPNTEDQQTRIAKGRSRATTRAEFETTQQQHQVRDAETGPADPAA